MKTLIKITLMILAYIITGLSNEIIVKPHHEISSYACINIPQNKNHLPPRFSTVCWGFEVIMLDEKSVLLKVNFDSPVTKSYNPQQICNLSEFWKKEFVGFCKSVLDLQTTSSDSRVDITLSLFAPNKFRRFIALLAGPRKQNSDKVDVGIQELNAKDKKEGAVYICDFIPEIPKLCIGYVIRSLEIRPVLVYSGKVILGPWIEILPSRISMDVSGLPPPRHFHKLKFP